MKATRLQAESDTKKFKQKLYIQFVASHLLLFLSPFQKNGEIFNVRIVY